MKKNTGRRPVPQRERGFALLMVFVMAAVIAITLYMEMPRVAFESQRAKEQLLVDRGNEYKRAIQLYFRKQKRFPSKIEDLESTSNMRFLRRRFKDPMTGKDDWRLVHVGPGGFLTDSLVQKPNPLGGKDQQKDQVADASQNPAGQPGQPLNANGSEGGGGINMATARRPSDTMVNGALGGAVAPGALPPSDGSQNPQQPLPPQYAVQPPYPVQQQYPGQQQYPVQQQYPGQPGVQPPAAGQPPAFTGPNGQPLFPGQPGFPTQIVQPVQPGQPIYPGQPGQVALIPGQTVPNQARLGQPAFPPGQQGQPYPNQPQFPGAFSPPGAPPNAQPANPPSAANAAITAIQNSLFSPRQPPPGFGGTSDNTVGGAGIAGVATTYKGEGIKRVNERSKYQEWEFVYDLKKDKTIMGNQAGQPTPGGPLPPGSPGPLTKP